MEELVRLLQISQVLAKSFLNNYKKFVKFHPQLLAFKSYTIHILPTMLTVSVLNVAISRISRTINKAIPPTS